MYNHQEHNLPPLAPHYIVVQSGNVPPNPYDDENGTFYNIPLSPPPPYSGLPPQLNDPTQPMVPGFHVQEEPDVPVNLFMASNNRAGNRNFIVTRPHEFTSSQINNQQIDDALKRAILSCICCFIPLGMFAIWNAFKARRSHKEKHGDPRHFIKESIKQSKLACKVGTILLMFYVIVVIIMLKQLT